MTRRRSPRPEVALVAAVIEALAADLTAALAAGRDERIPGHPEADPKPPRSPCGQRGRAEASASERR